MMSMIDDAKSIVEIKRFQTPPGVCSYLWRETASLEYRSISRISSVAYQGLLERGWRRFGTEFFRPACPHCTKCRSIRLLVPGFSPSRTQTRALKRNQHIRAVWQAPTATRAHVALYNAYHAYMHSLRHWRFSPTTVEDYYSSFVTGGGDFAREVLYFDRLRLVGVALVDLVPNAVSSVYFFHDPAWRHDSPGVFSILHTIQFAQEHGLSYHYLGYWIKECRSMAYKSGYRPHELLERYLADDESPVWSVPSAFT